MQNKLIDTKLYIGPMSHNIIDSMMDFSLERPSLPVGLIASRRQIDHTGGYVNGWTTQKFSDYVRGRAKGLTLCRDHGGPSQGRRLDSGSRSFTEDLRYMDVIHIDPWKSYKFSAGVDYTVRALNEYSPNTDVRFEVGTEQSIMEYSPDGLLYLLRRIEVETDALDKIAYVVVQAGTSLQAGKNTGQYDESRLVKMLEVCKDFGLSSKEHNGDYQTPDEIKAKYALGLSAVNIAPEIAHIETEYILTKLTDSMKDSWFKLCMEDGQWAKWFPAGYDTAKNRDEVLRLCGHYVFSHASFPSIFALNTAFLDVKKLVYKFLLERLT